MEYPGKGGGAKEDSPPATDIEYFGLKQKIYSIGLKVTKTTFVSTQSCFHDHYLNNNVKNNVVFQSLNFLNSVNFFPCLSAALICKSLEV